MPGMIFILFCKLMAEIVRAVLQKVRTEKPDPICAECVFAHMQYTNKGKRAISCTYGGRVRAMTLDVLYCTDFRNRAIVVPVRIIGFARDVVECEPVSAKMATQILVSPVAKTTVPS
jgi:hypothetical protein